MPYPVETPKAKHDFMVSSEEELSPGAVFRQLDQPIDPHALTMIATIYSYPDGPRSPGPLSRSLTVIGLLEATSPLAQKLLDPYSSHACLDKCTIGVKRFHPSLPDKDKHNSGNFAKFITKLRRRELVAVLSKDKYGRFGILRPMQDDDDEKFAADCFVGDAERAQSALGKSNGRTASALPPAADDGMWKPPGGEDDQDEANNNDSGFWQPPGTNDASTSNGADGGFWKPPGGDEEEPAFNFGNTDSGASDPWGTQDNTNYNYSHGSSNSLSGKKRSADEIDDDDKDKNIDGDTFHTDAGAAAADKFYSGLTRTLDTRSESKLFHMRAFNGWVKATQIQELNPMTVQPGRKKKGPAPMRVLDLACGKGGDLGKWILHSRKISNYVGVDVARGSLKDAAIRARGLRSKLPQCTFTVADLGSDVPGRLKSANSKHMQKLMSWSLLSESEFESGTPEFTNVRGGGISLDDKFDVISIQFAIHYMMQTKKRARRFFRTVSELLEIGGNLIATTIDARVILQKLMDLGEDLHFDSEEWKQNPDREIVVTAGDGACRVRFQKPIVEKIFQAVTMDGDEFTEDVFGLEYTFTLVEGSDHAAGIGQAVDLPEWLIPIPVLKSLAEEAGLEMEYGLNFHEFYNQRKDPSNNAAAHLALYNMKVLNKNGSISPDEWGISRLYCAVKFRKVREAGNLDLDGQSDDEDDGDEEEQQAAVPAPAPSQDTSKFYVKALMKAKMSVGNENWAALSGDEKKRLTQIELEKLMSG